jgi:hypothetical protein
MQVRLFGEYFCGFHEHRGLSPQFLFQCFKRRCCGVYYINLSKRRVVLAKITAIILQTKLGGLTYLPVHWRLVTLLSRTKTPTVFFCGQNYIFHVRVCGLTAKLPPSCPLPTQELFFNRLIMDGIFSGAPQPITTNKAFHRTLAIVGLSHLGGALCIMVPSVQSPAKLRNLPFTCQPT